MQIRRTAALLATATSLLAAGGASASPTASLTIQRTANNECRMVVSASTTTPVSYPGRVVVWVYGADDWSADDFLGGPFQFGFDQSFANVFWMPGGCSALNEDWGTDEIYAAMDIYNGQNKFIEELRSNTWSGSF
jgi:hypothetical protein